MPVPAEGQIQYQQGGSFDPKLPVRFTARVQFDGDVNLLDTVTVNATVANDNSTHFLAVDGTLPENTSGFVEGIVFNVESAGTSAIGSTAQSIYFEAGYTGSGQSIALYVTNSVAGTGSSISIGHGNQAIQGDATSTTTGTNTGVFGTGRQGDKNVGVVGTANGNKNGATNVGVVGMATNTGTTPIIVGGHFELLSGTPTFESSALVADNSALAAPIFLARDNGTKVWTIQDGGSIQGKMGTKALTAGAATGFVRVACAQGARTAGFVKYTIEADDGADFQIRTGILPFAIVNKGGTETGAVATVSTATETVAVSAGTLTNTFTITSNAADTMDIEANAASSLVETTLRINYSVELYGNAIVTVTPL